MGLKCPLHGNGRKSPLTRDQTVCGEGGVRGTVTRSHSATPGLQSVPSGCTSAVLTQAALRGKRACGCCRWRPIPAACLSSRSMARVAGSYGPQARGKVEEQSPRCVLILITCFQSVTVVLLGSVSPAFTVVSWLPEKVHGLVFFPPRTSAGIKNTPSQGARICPKLLTSQ